MNNFWICMVMVAVSLGLTASVSAEIITKVVAYEHEGVQLQGYLAYDAALDEPRPGVLVIHEWWGHNDYARSRARQLAELGYVAFALDMYGKGKVTADPKQAGAWAGQFYGKPLARTRTTAGLNVLKSQPMVDGDRLAAIGYCFGGTMALELAYSGAPVAGIVSFHGSLPAPKPNDNITASILICHGAADDFISSQEIQTCTEALTEKNIDWQMIAYGGAVHSFTNPNAGKANIPGVAYQKEADQRSWQHMQLFFDDLFND